MKTPWYFFIVCLICACENAPNFEGGNPDRSARKAEFVENKVDESAHVQGSYSGRKLIKTGYLEIRVSDIGDTKREIQKIANESQAHISSETLNDYPDRLKYEQVIRIPAENFNSFLEKVEALGNQVESKNIQTSDVTEEYIDNESRVKTKKELEQRYLEILKSAKVVSDMLSIEAQLNHVRSDIESMEGRLTYLRNQVAFSTLTVSFYQPVGTQFGFGSKIVSSFKNGWDMLLIFLIGLLSVWPFILMAALIISVTIRKTRMNKRIHTSETELK